MLASNPSHTRYWLPVLALTSGPVVMAVASGVSRATIPLVTVVIAVSLGIGMPQAGPYRQNPSPAMAALAWAGQHLEDDNGIVVVDRTLRSFATYDSVARNLEWTVVDDFQIEIGVAMPGEDEIAAVVFPTDGGGFVDRYRDREDFFPAGPWLRRVEPRRFLAITAVAAASVSPRSTSW
jgi:hypothetical protein